MKELFSSKGKFYKANLHMHTTVSDGRMSPEETKAAYKERGYSIVAFTDHEVIVPHNELIDDEFIAITGAEFCVPGHVVNSVPICYHLNFLAKRPDLCISSAFTENMVGKRQRLNNVTDEMRVYNDSREYSIEHVNDMLARAEKEGFLVTLNHPFWSTQSYADYAGLKGLWGIECYNNGCGASGFEESTKPIDDLLHFDENPFPIAADDAHGRADEPNFGDCFGGFVMVKADRLDYETIMKALENGDFYASSGPEIYSLSYYDGKLNVKCSPAARIIVNTDCRFAARVNAKDKLLSEASIDISQWLGFSRKPEHYVCRPYFRVTVVDAKGDRAWTRAYYLDDICG